MSSKQTQTNPESSTTPCFWTNCLATLRVLLCLVFVLAGPFANAQMFPLLEFTETRSILPTSDEGFVVAGRVGQPLVSGQDDAYMAKMDPDGLIQWQYSYGGLDAEDIVAITQNANGQYAFTGYTNSFDVNGSASDVFVGLVNPDGSLVWERSLGGMQSDRGNGIAATNDGGVVVTGCWDCFGQADLYFTKINSSGIVEWAYHNYNPGYKAEGFSITPTSDGGFALTGTIDQGNGTLLFLLKTDANGQEQWQQVFGGTADDAGYDIIEAANGDLIVVGMSFSFSFTSEDVYLLRTTSAGQYLWHNSFGTPDVGDFGFAVEELPSGEIVVAGSTWSYGAGNGDAYLIKTDAVGNEIWSRTYGTLNEETGRSLELTADGGFLVAGINRSFDGQGMITGSTGLVVRTDAEGLIDDHLIRGVVFDDASGDCAFQNGEGGLAGWIVRLEGAEKKYTTTDANGNYDFLVSPGNYELTLFSPNYNWEPCLAPLPIMVQGIADTLDLDLPVSKEITSPYLEVDVSTSDLTICSNQTYYVNYCNKGSSPATNARVQLELDAYFTYLNSSINWSSQNGQMYTFDLGDIVPWQCGSFEIEVALACDAPVGFTHCMEAHIFPDSIALPANPIWDGSNLEIEAACVADTAVFIVRNTSNSMAGTQNYIVIEDDLAFLTGPIQLAFGEQEIIKRKPNGKTYRLQVNQSPGHPGKSQPSASIEGCGTDANGNISLAYVTQFPEDDADFFVSIDCQENATDFLPFEKKSYPKGTQTAHFIDANTDLEYHIRFQNTLPDTAHTLVIRDTLSPFLDITSIRPGASSHPYTFEVYGNGIIKFTFSNIDLPPASTDGVASVGFVKFRTGQLPDNPPGTVITNTSAISFDYHPAILSPEVFHTIRHRVVYEAASASVCLGEAYQGIVYDTSTYLYDTISLSNYDSITITNLTVHLGFVENIDTTICEGDLFQIGTYQFGEPGMHQAVFINQYGCDSVYQIDLEVLLNPLTMIYEEICEGDSLAFGGNIYTVGGKYISILSAANGCDSSIHLSLNVLPAVFTQVDTMMSEGQMYHEVVIEIDTTFQETYSAANGCDSIVTVNVTVLTTGQNYAPQEDLAFNLFPNPTNGDLILHYQLNHSEEVEIRLYHSLGQLAAILYDRQHQVAGSYSHHLSIAEQPPGTYFLWISTGRGIQIRKVIKWD